MDSSLPLHSSWPGRLWWQMLATGEASVTRDKWNLLCEKAFQLVWELSLRYTGTFTLMLWNEKRWTRIFTIVFPARQVLTDIVLGGEERTSRRFPWARPYTFRPWPWIHCWLWKTTLEDCLLENQVLLISQRGPWLPTSFRRHLITADWRFRNWTPCLWSARVHCLLRIIPGDCWLVFQALNTLHVISRGLKLAFNHFWGLLAPAASRNFLG